MKTIPTLEATVRRMKKEILADVVAGVVPDTVRSFAALHDYVDANRYGGTEELHDLTDAEDAAQVEALHSHINAAQNQIDLWLRAIPPDAVTTT